MQTFIQETIQDILRTTQTFENVTLVLPSNRARVFIKQALKNENFTGFLPKISTIEEFTEQVSGIKKADTILLLFYFYKIYKEHQSDPDNFAVFSSWAFTVLQDFNEIDQHLVDAYEVFVYIRDVQRLRKWSVERAFKETDLMKDYFAFTEKLHEYYIAFYDFLIENKIGYQGCLYREAAKNIEVFLADSKDRKFFFIGFNALNKSEEYMMKQMLLEGNTEIYWDIDEVFLYSKHQAGTFIRKYKTSWKYYQTNDIKTVSNWFSKEKNIQLTGVTKNVTQMKYAGELLEKLPSHQNTALVLADESLLPVILNSLPENVSSVNITMGYPLKDMPSTSLFLSIFQLFISQEKLQKKEAELFYYKEVIKLLKEPFLYRLLVINETSLSEQIIRIIFKENRTFIGKEYLSSFLNTLEEKTKMYILSVFSPYKTVDEFLERIIALIDFMKNDIKGLEKEFLFRYYTTFNQLQNLQLEFGYFSDIKSLYQFFKQLITSENLSFQGEPLQGLQLMGMLETRLLDFENIIITSVNEGIFPAGTKQTSFIPFDAKVHFGLPTYREKDAIFSYHFFRLIQRASNVFLLYNTEIESFGSGEKSRFITQLELLKEGIKSFYISPKVTANLTTTKEIKKNNEILSKLKELGENGISPSSLTNYLYNPIAFYKKKVLRIREFDNLEEEIGFDTLGNVVHETLEDLYKPFKGQFLQADNVIKMQEKVNPLVQKYFSEYFKNGTILTGKNRLIFEVAIRFVSNFLQHELAVLKDKNNELKIIEIEKEYKAFITVKGIDFPIKIRGKVDRIDELNGVTRIIDYKTGLTKESDLKISNINEVINLKYSKVIQVFLYAYLFTQNETDNEHRIIEAGIISFKRLKSGFMKLNFSPNRNQDYIVTSERIHNFIEEIKELIREIYNPEIPFSEPDELSY